VRLEELASGPPLDAAIIGGGINGCAIARDLAHRGLRVALFEREDFGFGTTWRSTKLIHGGLRYLEHGDAGLVFESLRERRWLLRTRPHLVRPLRFMLPLLPWTRRPAWQLALGLTAYDVLAGRDGLPGHRRLSLDAARRGAPAMAAVSGAFTFSDAMALSPERLALELALEAEQAGAAIFNHAPVTSIEVAAGRVAAISVGRRDAGEPVDIPVRAVVNAAGPWVDAVNALSGEGRRQLLGVTRGSHVVFEPPEGFVLKAAVLSTARADGRVFFAIPRDGLLVVGTTDERAEPCESSARPTLAEVDYLLSEAEALFPGAGLGRERVRYCYAGLRPLQQIPGGPEEAISRRHAVIRHGRAGGPEGLFSVAGGKLSTFRPLAADVARALGATGDPGWPREAKAPSAGGRASIYGASATSVAGLGTDTVCPHSGLTEGEIRHSIRFEHASTLSDILMRRTGMAWSGDRGLCCHREAAAVAAPEVGWDEAAEAGQVAAFEADVRRNLPVIAEVEP
jgi:glycerol-3-phosphate dehydrogenase